MKLLNDICYAKRENKELLLDIYLPDNKEFSVFVFFHGGALMSGSKSDAKEIAMYLNERNISVVSVDYRIYPNAKYPEFIEDTAEAVHWVSEHICDYGKCNKIFIGGSSAGAYLSMMLCFDSHWLSKFGEFKIPIAGFFHNAGQPTCHYKIIENERSVSKKRIIVDDSAPIYHVGVAEKYPPMHFVVSDDDMECRYEQTMLMLATLKHFGYDSKKIGFTLSHGKHCQQDKTVDENGDNILGKMIFEFINKWQFAINT